MDTLVFILYTLKDVAFLVVIAAMLTLFFRAEKQKNKLAAIICVAIIIAYSAFAAFYVSKHIDETFEYMDGISFVFTVLALFAVLKKPPVWATICLSSVFIFTVDMLWSFMSSFFGQNLIAEMIFDIVICSALFIPVYLSGRKHGEHIFAGVFHEIPKWIIFVLLFFEITCYYREFGISARWYDFLYAISACMVFICILFLVYKIFSLVFTQNTILQRLNEQLAFSEISAKSDEALRAFRHDYKNHIIVLNSMFEQGDYSGAKEYFDALTDTVAEEINRFSTGNTVVNSLLTVKKTVAEKYNTEIVFDGYIPQDGIENKDMCTVMGNLLDNALEACSKLPEKSHKVITIHSYVKNNSLVLSVKNPCKDNNIVNSADSLPRTTKNDSRSHGFGLRNVKKVVEQYKGSVTLKSDDCFFCAEIIMQLNSNQNADRMITCSD